MLAGLFQATNLASKPLKILHLGTGAGVMPNFLIHQLEKIEKLVTVDINESMIKVAKKYFGFCPDDKIVESVQADAFEYVK